MCHISPDNVNDNRIYSVQYDKLIPRLIMIVYKDDLSNKEWSSKLTTYNIRVFCVLAT